MFSIIQNGLLSKKKSVQIPYKGFCHKVLSILYKEGYINGFRLLPSSPKKIEIFLKYDNGKPMISKILLMSTPSRRIYLSVKNLWKVNCSLQTMIFTTNKGIFSDKDLRKYGLGGELLYIIE